MNSEIEVLKTILENGGKSSIGLISDQLGFGIDYTYYLHSCLLKKGQIKPVKGKRNWYEISSKGERDLRLRGITEPKLPRKARGIEGVVYYSPKKIEATLSKIGFQKTTVKKPKGNLIKTKEKILNLGQTIEKAVFLLKRSNKEEK